jgi:hypothetical protein
MSSILANTFPDVHENFGRLHGFPDFPTSLPDFFLAAFGRHCFPEIFRIVGNLPGSVATTLPGF